MTDTELNINRDFGAYKMALERYNADMKEAADKVNMLTHMAIRDCCPFTIGKQAKIYGTQHHNAMMRVDEISLGKRMLHGGQWCWILGGRLISKATGGASNRKVTSAIPVKEENESDIEKQEAS